MKLQLSLENQKGINNTISMEFTTLYKVNGFNTPRVWKDLELKPDVSQQSDKKSNHYLFSYIYILWFYYFGSSQWSYFEFACRVTGYLTASISDVIEWA